MAEFPEIVGLGFAPGPVKHDVRHYVETKGPPISTPVYRLDSQKYAGPPPFTWCLNPIVLGAPVEIFADSTM